MKAYYNENDPVAAQWLRNLISAGHIAPGDVDERSITEVRADDVKGYTQCHFFGGIGGWSLALRLAGWTDDRPVWTGSCPCPPFSSAGKKKRCPECQGREVIPHPLKTGIFACVGCAHEWFADGRHLWPEFRRLIAECRPAIVLGEQVSGADGLVWLAGVRATLETLGYGLGGIDTCAPSVGAPHIRQRLYWLANLPSSRRERAKQSPENQARDEARMRVPVAGGGYGPVLRLALPGPAERGLHASDGGGINSERMGSPIRSGLEGHARHGDDGNEPGRGASEAGSVAAPGAVSGMADSAGRGLGIDGSASGSTGHADERGTVERVGQPAYSETKRLGRDGTEILSHEITRGDRASSPRSDYAVIPCADGKYRRVPAAADHTAGGGWIAERLGVSDIDGFGTGRITGPRDRHGDPADPTGFWSDYAVIPCADGKYRRVPAAAQPQVLGVVDGLSRNLVRPCPDRFPLAAKTPGRAGKLRGIGNAIVPPLAAEFIKAFMEI